MFKKHTSDISKLISCCALVQISIELDRSLVKISVQGTNVIFYIKYITHVFRLFFLLLQVPSAFSPNGTLREAESDR